MNDYVYEWFNAKYLYIDTILNYLYLFQFYIHIRLLLY